MIATPTSSLDCHVASSQEQYGVTMRKNLANSTDHASASRRWFRNLLYKAFPSPSDCDLADKAARVLDVSPRQVRNWLREENDASLRYVTAVMAIAGAEVVFGKIAPRHNN